MSNTQVIGIEKMTWTVGDDDYEYLFRVPLQAPRYGHRQRRYVYDSLDYSARDVVTIGTGVYELVGRERLSEDPEGLLAMLVAGANGVQLAYRKSGVLVFGVNLIEPSGDLIELLLDEDRGPLLEYAVDLRFRRCPSGSFFSV